MLETEFEAEADCPVCGKETMMYYKDGGGERDSSNDYQECLECGWHKWGFSDEWYPPEDEYLSRRRRGITAPDIEKTPVGCFLAFIIIVAAAMFTAWLINLL